MMSISLHDGHSISDPAPDSSMVSAWLQKGQLKLKSINGVADFGDDMPMPDSILAKKRFQLSAGNPGAISRDR
jgi:hypothetical protein